MLTNSTLTSYVLEYVSSLDLEVGKHRWRNIKQLSSYFIWGRLLFVNALAYLLHPTLCLVNFFDKEVKYRQSTTLVYASIGYEILLLMPCRLLNTFASKLGFRYILDCVLLNLAY